MVVCGPFIVVVLVSEASAGLREKRQAPSADSPLAVDLSAAPGPEALQGAGTPAESLARLQVAGAPGVVALRAHQADIVSLQQAPPAATTLATPCADGTVRLSYPPLTASWVHQDCTLYYEAAWRSRVFQTLFTLSLMVHHMCHSHA